MSILEIWKSSKHQIEDKSIQQIIAFAGDGNLKDDGILSIEFREFLYHVPSSYLKKYSLQCLEKSFDSSGLVLQDIVNQVGRRLGFKVIDGRYRGTSNQIGFDGLWEYSDGHNVIVEVKTTDAYRFDLETFAEYRKSLIEDKTVSEANSSILIVVGRMNTGDLEAQIRGSRHAWDIRLISIDALLKLMMLKEDLEDPHIIKRIHDILIPYEFTKLDKIIDIVFSTTEEVKPDFLDPNSEETTSGPKFTPVSFNEACIDRIQRHLSCNLIKRSQATFSTPDENIGVFCTVSKVHERSNSNTDFFWYAFHPHQKDFLEKSDKSYIAFGCGDENTILLIPSNKFTDHIGDLNITKREDRLYWHVHITREEQKFSLHLKGKENRVDFTEFLLKK